MRLSDAIAMGRMLAKPCPGAYIRSGPEACALGMAALAAINLPHVRITSTEILAEWPWLRIVLPIPCECGGETSVRYIIEHLFDDHVIDRHGCNVWTLDQLIDWIRSVEPAEAEEVQAMELIHANETEVAR